MTYLETRSMTLDGGSIGVLTTIPPTLATHGVKMPVKITKAIDHHAAIVQGIRDMASSLESTAHENAATALANGTATLEQVTAAAAAQIIADTAHGSPAARIFNNARTKAASALVTAFKEVGEGWITVLKPAIDKAAATIIEHTQYAPEYDAFRDRTAADHWTSNPAIADAWATLKDLYDITRTLRRVGAIPNATGRDDWYEWAGDGTHYEQRAGDRLQASVRENLVDKNLTWFLMAVQHGMTPTLLTPDEARAQRAEAA